MRDIRLFTKGRHTGIKGRLCFFIHCALTIADGIIGLITLGFISSHLNSEFLMSDFIDKLED